MLGLIRDGLKKNPNKWTKYAEALQGAHARTSSYGASLCAVATAK